jgi:hypothetical protein
MNTLRMASIWAKVGNQDPLNMKQEKRDNIRVKLE